MKLRNKQTGEIKECVVIPIDSNGYPNEYEVFEKGESLAELEREWEDYETPKDHWHIGCEGDVFIDNTERYLKSYSSIGNDFLTKEEAEKAVEKLKAVKRLKDKGFRFVEGWLDINDDFIIKAKLGTVGLIDQPDINLLFGGKECVKF